MSQSSSRSSQVHFGSASREDTGAIAQLFSDAFAPDPVWSAIVPNEQRRRRTVKSGFKSELEAGGYRYVDVARTDSGPLLGALNYLPPGATTPTKHAFAEAVERITATITSSGRRGRTHDAAVQSRRPAQPHWYFRDIVTSPEARGKGIGSALLRNRLAVVDEDPMPVFLESTTAGSRRLYERYGFEHVETLTAIPGGTVFIMVRPALRTTVE